VEPTYSFILPVYNEREILPAVFGRMSDLMAQLDAPSEVIFVDDGSRDGSHELILEARRTDPRFKLVRFARNFGHQIAITAGMDHARGRAIIVMDADLQDPPEVALTMIQEWKQGFEVVYAVRSERLGESWFKKTTAGWFYRLLGACAEIDIPLDTGDFRLVDRRALTAFQAMPERARFVRGMFAWVGFKQKAVSFVRQGRAAGVTKYSGKAMLRLATNALLSFSKVPLRLPFYAAGAFAAGALLAVACGLVGWLTRAEALGGLAVLGCASMQAMMLGWIGLYLGQMHDEAKKRPLYLVSTLHGVEPAAQVTGSAVTGIAA
jgi:dolichol-phosphate mannosyltransferase